MYNSIPNLDGLHNTIDPHGIFKHHCIGHQRHAWLIRTNQKVQDVYKYLWNTNELVVSFDGSCYIDKSCSKKDNIWTHTDQSPQKKGLHCYQGYVSLTTNEERTFVVYEGSHSLHEQYFIDTNNTSNNNWQLINHKYLESIKDQKRILKVSAGSMVLWDSRTLHQNQYGKPNSEDRLVQYICYLPKSHIKNTIKMQEKRLTYFNQLRTTSHWPCPIKVNSLQPRTFGDDTLTIDYSILPSPNLDDLRDEIIKII